MGGGTGPGSWRPRSARAAVGAAVGLVLTVAGATWGPEPVPAADAAVAPPNVVVILTDDQRWDQLAAMPTVQAELAGKGRLFTNAFAVDPWCCPSRVSLLRGQYPHTTRIYRLGGALGGADTFRKKGGDAHTIATMLDGAGYRTAMMGKYLNGYDGADFAYVPPGWDVWRAFETIGSVPYFDYRMSVDGQTVAFGSDPADYSTDVLAGYADAFIRGTPADTPLFLYLAPGAPHVPMVPAPRHATSKACVARTAPPSLGEANVADKPDYVKANPWSDLLAKKAAQKWTKSCRSLLAVDDAVGTVLDALEDTGRLGSTLIVYTSDNGYLFGEHRIFGKKVPYDESIRLPLVVRYDALTGGTASVDDRLVVNVDVTATALDAAGVAPTIPLEGESFLPAVAGEQQPRRDAVLAEHYDPPSANGYVPPYCVLRTETHAYIRYDAGTDAVKQELYDVSSDPYQLDNLMRIKPKPLELRDRLLRRLQELCVPPPPNFTY